LYHFLLAAGSCPPEENLKPFFHVAGANTVKVQTPHYGKKLGAENKNAVSGPYLLHKFV
jgi:hypothetical protein